MPDLMGHVKSADGHTNVTITIVRYATGRLGDDGFLTVDVLDDEVLEAVRAEDDGREIPLADVRQWDYGECG